MGREKRISIGILALSFLNPLVGSAQYARGVSRAFPKNFDITVYSFEGKAREEFKSHKNFKFVTVEKPKKTGFFYLEAARRIIELLTKMERHDVLIYTGALETYVAYLYRMLKNSNTKIIGQFHHIRGSFKFSDQIKVSGLSGLVEYMSFPLSKTFDAIITVSKTWKKKIKNELGFDKPIYVAYNSVEPDKRGNMKIKFGRPIIYTGMCQPIHNIELVIKALPLVKKKYPDASLVITGRRDEKYYMKLVEMARELGVEKDIHYLGIISNEDVRSVYEQSDVVFFVTLDPYGWSRVLLKGVLYKTPCISMRVGALTELIQRYGGILINNKPKEFANAVEKFVNDKEFTKKTVEKAYKNLQKDTWDAAAKTHVKCIENLLRDN